jgi:hypothetical protein
MLLVYWSALITLTVYSSDQAKCWRMLGKLYSTGYVVTFMLAYVLKWRGIVGVEVQLHTSLISALYDGKWLAVHPGRKHSPNLVCS